MPCAVVRVALGKSMIVLVSDWAAGFAAIVMTNPKHAYDHEGGSCKHSQSSIV
jgi:hypothetical protein